MNAKLLFTVIDGSLSKLLGWDHRIFSANNSTLDKDKADSDELVYVMPGIGLAVMINPEMDFIIAYTNYIFDGLVKKLPQNSLSFWL